MDTTPTRTTANGATLQLVRLAELGATPEAAANRDIEAERIRNLPHWDGTKYEATKDLDITEVAKLIRKDIKAALKAGTLPDGKYTVRCERYSMGQSITVSAKIEGPDRVRGDDPRSAMTPKELAGYTYIPEHTMPASLVGIQGTLQGIVDAYNRDRSDTLTDYFENKFAGSVNVRGTEPVAW